MNAGTHDLQELAKTYYQVSRARTKVQHSLINHGLPLYFPEMHRFGLRPEMNGLSGSCSSSPPAHVRSLTRSEFVEAAWDVVGRKVNKRAKLEEMYAGAQILAWILDVAVVLHAARLFDESTGPPQLQPVVAYDVVHCVRR